MKLIDLTGKRFGRLIVLSRAEDKTTPGGQHSTMWNCICDCGNSLITYGQSLKNGSTTSCGCYAIENTIKRSRKYNTYDLTGDYGIGKDEDNNIFYFDIEDYNKINQNVYWYPDKEGYIVAKINKKIIKMHRLIMGVEKYQTEIIDHINHKVFDNRKCNLRICNDQQNAMNKSILSNNTSGVTGVDYKKDSNKWRARIGYKGKSYSLGYFTNFEDAVKARKEAEVKYFGEYRNIM